MVHDTLEVNFVWKEPIVLPRPEIITISLSPIEEYRTRYGRLPGSTRTSRLRKKRETIVRRKCRGWSFSYRGTIDPTTGRIELKERIF